MLFSIVGKSPAGEEIEDDPNVVHCNLELEFGSPPKPEDFDEDDTVFILFMTIVQNVLLKSTLYIQRF